MLILFSALLLCLDLIKLIRWVSTSLVNNDAQWCLRFLPFLAIVFPTTNGVATIYLHWLKARQYTHWFRSDMLFASWNITLENYSENKKKVSYPGRPTVENKLSDISMISCLLSKGEKQEETNLNNGFFLRKRPNVCVTFKECHIWRRNALTDIILKYLIWNPVPTFGCFSSCLLLFSELTTKNATIFLHT